MWTDIKIKDTNYIERIMEEYTIWMPQILPCGKMKVKISKSNADFYSGSANICIIRKYDNNPEGTGGGGRTIEEALENVINNFLEMVKEDYPDGLPWEAIVYAEDSDF